MRLTKLRVAAAATAASAALVTGGLLAIPADAASSCYARAATSTAATVQRTDQADSRDSTNGGQDPVARTVGLPTDHLQLLPVLRHGPAALWRQQHLVPHLRRRHPQVGLRRGRQRLDEQGSRSRASATAARAEAGNGRRVPPVAGLNGLSRRRGRGNEPRVSRAARGRRDRVDLTRVTAIGPPRSTWEPRPGPHRTSQAPSGRAGGRGSPCVVRVNASSSPSR